MSLPEGWTPEQFAKASADELAAGRLPLSAQWRLAAQRSGKAFTSGLSTAEFTALRSIGFSPVGQVMGSAVYHVGWTSGCGYARWGGGLLQSYQPAPVVDVPQTRQLLEQARHRALHRLEQECAGLHADGVVGVQLTVGPFYGNGLEFVATGTAVRADGERRPPRVFTSDLSGQDFVKLVRGGWLPVAFVMGVGVALRHDDWIQRRQERSWANQELVGLTQLQNAARTSAREALHHDVRRHGAAGVVLRDLVVQLSRLRCRRGGRDEEQDHFAEALLFGTAITALHARDTDPATRVGPLPMLRLERAGNPQGRRSRR